jgi:hypothetical protein
LGCITEEERKKRREEKEEEEGRKEGDENILIRLIKKHFGLYLLRP